MTIHQPSNQIIDLIDNLMILGNGRELYYGPTKNMPLYFESINYPIPSYYNPTEYVLNLVNQDFIGDTR